MRTALITGASAGIGAAFARRLAGDAHGLVLVARNEARLAAFAEELAKEHGVPTEVLRADLATDAGIAAVEARLTDADRPVDLLVNNAGFGFKKGFLDVPIEDELAMLKVHIEAVLRLTRAAVPGMTERGKGYVVNVASVAAFVPRGTYGASKSWVVQFTAGANRDLAGTGVRLQALCPGFTRTEFHQRAEMDMSRVGDWLWLDADHVVDQSLRDLARGRSICVPSRRYQALVALSRKAPLGALGGMSNRMGRRPTER
ncbi:SDR family NAD(P)-dependent oxidoreductase [Streptacidiphilus rugosus]|uniref:SDR family NAD(P)-dependent oxidoreductase n=1 Tax=Streptacidiphilus rugosus TaxID=405783 RepID=UPI000559E7D1|nr:SDR family oxidoreductase [Streptacidiphilus rugosus]